MSAQNQKRRRWLVHPRYQMRFAMGLVALNLTVGFFYQVALHYRVRELARRSGSLEAFLATDPWVSIWPAMVVATAFSALVVFYIGIRYSHQIVGPLPRISRTMTDLALGKNPPRLQVRSSDVLADLVGAVNLLAETLRDESPAESRAGAGPSTEVVRVDAASVLGEARDRESIER